ncbi:MAG TPA: hypothetical protein VGO90_09770 [Chthoniobacteraceae bacterium]|jgi:hypothetical protein|nr:hypothetical protein [Chthoniobacteraceae bacterium]
MTVGSLLAVTVTAVAAAPPAEARSTASKPSKVTASVRIESPAKTLFNGFISTRLRSVNPGAQSDPGCAAPLNVVARSAYVSAVTLLADAARKIGGNYTASSTGPQANVCAISGLINNDATGERWSLRINNHAAMADSIVKNGDDVLWYFAGPDVTRSVDLILPSRIPTGRLVAGRVRAYDNATNARIDIADIGLAVAGTALNRGTDGRFKLKISTPGRFLIDASAPKSVRGSASVCVYRPGSGDCGTKKRKKR